MHSTQYRRPEQFTGQDVLVIGEYKVIYFKYILKLEKCANIHTVEFNTLTLIYSYESGGKIS